MPASHHHAEFPAELLRDAKAGQRITAVLPSREVASTIVPIVEALLSLDDLLDQILVVDAASEDGTADLARGLGVDVRQEAELLPQFGPVAGKGDAMWRALAAVEGDIVVYLDSDTLEFPPHFATGLIGPLLTRPELQFVKGAFRRPFHADGVRLPDGGGRVTELAARPLLSAFYPELAAFHQPLAGETAARLPLLERIPFATGYAVEVAMLIDVQAEVGLPAMAQVDLGVRHNVHQPLAALGPMAHTVLTTVIGRLARDGRFVGAVPEPYRSHDGRVVETPVVERPPFASLRALPR